MDLIPYIYHELQEKNGSMLCAQHALNNLLQQHIYSEVDLADLAAELDRRENATLDVTSQRKESQNMDDTGFFSLSVLENSLQVWGLTLVRWRSEEMQAYHDHPENQAAFILNLESHWMSIRRFSSPKRWYNLNSFLPSPEWISPTYLAMVLSQAEEEGYSVFVVRPLDGTATENMETQSIRSILPESQADLVALELGEPEGRTSGGVSIAATRHDTSDPTPIASSSSQPSYKGVTTSATSSDPVQVSLARSRAALQAFQSEQEAALRYGAGPSRSSRRRRQPDVSDMPGEEEIEGMRDESDPVDTERQPQQMNRFQRQQAEEAEMMRQAIEASLAEARDRGDKVEETPGARTPEPTASATYAPATSAVRINPADDEELDVDMEREDSTYDLLADQRHYDDEDAALQAALTASLVDASPTVLTLPHQQPVRRSSSVVQPVVEEQRAPVPVATAASSVANGTVPSVSIDVDKEDDDEEEEEVVEELSPEELRRKRLERFK